MQQLLSCKSGAGLAPKSASQEEVPEQDEDMAKLSAKNEMLEQQIKAVGQAFDTPAEAESAFAGLKQKLEELQAQRAV